MERNIEQNYTKIQKGHSEFNINDPLVGDLSIETWLYGETNGHECIIELQSLLDDPKESGWGHTVFKGSLKELIQIVDTYNKSQSQSV